MLSDIWFWAFVATYFGGGLAIVLWLTDGGPPAGVKRWRLVAVVALWPLPLISGAVEWVVSWALSTGRS